MSNISQNAPFKVTVEGGKKYAWCSCSLSDTQPFCDGKHKDSGYKPLVFTAPETQELLLCGCKETNNPPYCDGTHNCL